ncbi:unnamed protein product [Miscanthus lutarioriparius]|uniref:Uncharacterized protein n=1 Tax=Miscanthus lutarioriparius TaxID=422564 RepID=A0A811S367_9POAL|nr:unnamed protein product [Miscanthus lutarioriparius]
MANQRELLPNRAVVQAQAGHRDHPLDAALALMLVGAAAAVSTSTDDADAEWVFLALVTWLLGVCLLSLVPVAGQFPQADRLVGAGIANAGAVLRRFFIPWN